jgi:hypothetical protein
VEVRQNNNGSKGLLIYKIDSSIAHGDGPIIAQKELLFSGNTLTLNGWKITPLDQDSSGVLFKIDRN